MAAFVKAVVIAAVVRTSFAFSFLPSSSDINTIAVFRKPLKYPEIQSRLHKSRLSEVVCMSKKDQRYKLAKRPDDEDRLLLTVAEQFRRREGQAQISWYPGMLCLTLLILSQIRTVRPCRDRSCRCVRSELQDILRKPRSDFMTFLARWMSSWKFATPVYLLPQPIPWSTIGCAIGTRNESWL